MIETIAVSIISFSLGFVSKTAFFSAKERHDVKKDKRNSLNDMLKSYHEHADEVVKRGHVIVSKIEKSGFEVGELFDFRLKMDRYIQFIETICANEYDEVFHPGSFDREFLPECIKAATKTIPEIHEIAALISSHQAIPYTDQLKDICPNLLRILKGKIDPVSYNEIENIYI